MRFRTLVWRELFNRKSQLATSFLANGPESILADEPTGDLDPDAAAKATRTLRIVEGQIHA